MNLLRQSTSQAINIGPFLDSTDFVTAETALTINQSDIKISKDGGALTAKNESSGGTHDADGWYTTTLDATDTATNGILVLSVTVAGAVPVKHEYMVVEGAIYDAYHASGNLPANMIAISGDSTAADNLEAMFDGTGYVDDNAPATQEQVGNISLASGGISTVAGSFVKAGAESETNTYTSTHSLDNVYHIVGPDAGNTDVYYEFNIGNNGSPQSIEWVGYAQSNGDSYTVYFYDWVDTAYDQVGIITAANGTTQQTRSFTAITNYVGTGSNQGKVRFRIVSSTGTAFATDRIICTYTQLASGIPNGSAITLAGATTNENLDGFGWTLDLNGQDISGSTFTGSVYIQGTATATNGTKPAFFNSIIGPVTVPADIVVVSSGILGDMTFTSTSGVTSDSLTIVNSNSVVPGGTAPVFDFSGVTKTTGIMFRNWSGGINITVNSFCTVSLDVNSGGTITINGSGGSVNVRGIVENVVDTSSEAVNITRNAAINNNTFNIEVDSAISDAALATAASLSTLSSNVSTLTSNVAVVDANVDTTLANLAIVDANVDSVLVNVAAVDTKVDTVTTNLATVDANVDTALVNLAVVDANVDTTLSNLAVVDSNVDAILVDTGTTIPAQIASLNDISVSDVLNTSMAESYASDGSTPSMAQCLYMIQQMLGDFSISGTTLTVKKLDGSTTAATYTLNSSTSPTLITRTS